MKTRTAITTLLGVAAFCAACATAMAEPDQDKVTHFTTDNGTQVTVVSGQPPHRSYGPKPAFDQLDTNHDGGISRDEAAAFIPLLNDFDNLAHHVERISKRTYDRWDYH
jgi:hypothetical protein